MCQKRLVSVFYSGAYSCVCYLSSETAQQQAILHTTALANHWLNNDVPNGQFRVAAAWVRGGEDSQS
jgi:hypothetical protein